MADGIQPTPPNADRGCLADDGPVASEDDLIRIQAGMAGVLCVDNLTDDAVRLCPEGKWLLNGWHNSD
jgi:hypothetical protein